MTTGSPTFFSDEELVKRLQIVLRDVAADGTQGARVEVNVREARNLAAELAGRIHADPAAWGIAQIPAPYRDDAAQDAFAGLLRGLGDYRGAPAVAQWFAGLAETSFRELWAISQRKAESPPPVAAPPAAPTAKPEDQERAQRLFDATDGPWQRFEREFPRDAFALRLRYLLRRTPEEMAIMTDTQDVRSVLMRVNRARDRFRMFCDQTGVDRGLALSLLAQLGEPR